MNNVRVLIRQRSKCKISTEEKMQRKVCIRVVFVLTSDQVKRIAARDEASPHHLLFSPLFLFFSLTGEKIYVFFRVQCSNKQLTKRENINRRGSFLKTWRGDTLKYSEKSRSDVVAIVAVSFSAPLQLAATAAMNQKTVDWKRAKYKANYHFVLLKTPNFDEYLQIRHCR